MTEIQVLMELAQGVTPRRPSEPFITDDYWCFIQRCWHGRSDTGPMAQEVSEQVNIFYSSCCQDTSHVTSSVPAGPIQLGITERTIVRKKESRASIEVSRNDGQDTLNDVTPSILASPMGMAKSERTGRRETRASINVRQNDALNEFENCMFPL